MATRPQTMYGLADSPIDLAAFAIDHGDGTGQPGLIAQILDGRLPGDLTRDDILDNLTLYWLTNTGVSAARLYWENTAAFFDAKDISIPFAISVFPDELYQAPRSWAERAYPDNLIHYNRLDRGGHFAAWEQPQLFSSEMRAAFTIAALKATSCRNELRIELSSPPRCCPRSTGPPRGSTPAPLTPTAPPAAVVLVSFGTYTCINWIRSLPYVRAWADKYAAHGLAVVGVQTPEFDFEGDLDNVGRAIKEMDVRYPLVVDNDYAVWQAFDNHYWPALYFVDAQGRIRHHHFGEGGYEQSEMVLQMLLREAGADVEQGLVGVTPHGVEAAADWATSAHRRPTSATDVPWTSPRPKPSCPTSDTPTRRRPRCAATSGRCQATGGSARCRSASTSPAGPSSTSSTLVTCTS